MPKPEIVIIAAVAENGVIGRDGVMPWRLKSDMQHFRTLTAGRPVVMGRKTYLSLSIKPLPGRTNIVVTRDANFTAPGVLVAPSLDAALQVACGDALRRGGAEIMVIGGAEIYAQAMARASRLEITRIHASPEGETHFPAIDRGWEEVARAGRPAGPADDAPFDFVTYRRTNVAKAGGLTVTPRP